jgi:hypothetical protein
METQSLVNAAIVVVGVYAAYIAALAKFTDRNE